MAAYLIINYDVSDLDSLEVYRHAAVPSLTGPAKRVARVVTDQTIDLGEGRGAGTDTVILEFPSVQAAQEAFKAPEYQAIIGDRLAATSPRFAMIVPTRAT